MHERKVETMSVWCWQKLENKHVYVLGNMCSAICCEVELVQEGLFLGIHIAESNAVDEATLNSRFPNFPQWKTRKHMKHAHYTVWACCSFFFLLLSPISRQYLILILHFQNIVSVMNNLLQFLLTYHCLGGIEKGIWILSNGRIESPPSC